MIKIILGNPGSGKTASAVRELLRNPTKRKTYSNIVTKHIKNNIPLEPSMIVKKDVIGEKKNGTPIHELKLNVDFWKDLNEPINVVLDEAHALINSRRGMSKVNVLMTDWMALIRRVLGSGDSGYGELVLITQLWNRLDKIARDMCTHVKFHRCHYQKTCKKCKSAWLENNDIPQPLFKCPRCMSNELKKHNHKIEVWDFQNMEDFIMWKDYHQETFYNHYFITDIEEVFPLYDTLQWDNLFSELY